MHTAMQGVEIEVV